MASHYIGWGPAQDSYPGIDRKMAHTLCIPYIMRPKAEENARGTLTIYKGEALLSRGRMPRGALLRGQPASNRAGGGAASPRPAPPPPEATALHNV